MSREEICTLYILLKRAKGGQNLEKKMANDNDVEDALDMSLKIGDNERQINVVEVRKGRNGEKIPLARIEDQAKIEDRARIERRSLDCRESVPQRGELKVLDFEVFALELVKRGMLHALVHCMNPVKYYD